MVGRGIYPQFAFAKFCMWEVASIFRLQKSYVPGATSNPNDLASLLDRLSLGQGFGLDVSLSAYATLCQPQPGASWSNRTSGEGGDSAIAVVHRQSLAVEAPSAAQAKSFSVRKKTHLGDSFGTESWACALLR